MAFSRFPKTEKSTADAPTECRAYPYAYWLRYLIVCTKLDYTALCSLLNLNGFPPPHQAYVTELRNEITAAKKPKRLTSPAGRTWLRRQRIYGLAMDGVDASDARDLLGNHSLRHNVEALLMAGATAEELHEWLPNVCGRMLPVRVLALYQHYFWDFSQMTPADIKAFCQQYGKSEGTYLWQYHARGVEFALWKLGYTVETTPKAAVTELFQESIKRFKELKHGPNTLDLATTSQIWAGIALKSIESMDSSGDEGDALRTKLSNFVLLAGENRTVPSLGDLRGDPNVIDVEAERVTT